MGDEGRLRRILGGCARPTIGQLTELRDENYRQLMRLAPDLAFLFGSRCSRRPDHPALHLSVLEQAPYCSLIRLTYRFGRDRGIAEPDAVLRAYHDARQVDVLELRHGLPTRPLYQAPALQNAWRAQLFLSKWLRFCRAQGHDFRIDVDHTRPTEAAVID